MFTRQVRAYPEIGTRLARLSLQTRRTLAGKAGINSDSEGLIKKARGEQLICKGPGE